MKFLICGGYGFIGSTFIRNRLKNNPNDEIINLDNLSLGSNKTNLEMPQEILEKDASPDVWSFPTNDEEFFYSVPYEIVDLILYARENNFSVDEIQKYSNLSIENIENLLRFQNQKEIKSKHMREIPHSWIPDF